MSDHGCLFCADVAPDKCLLHERTFWGDPYTPYRIMGLMLPVALIVLCAVLLWRLP